METTVTYFPITFSAYYLGRHLTQSRSPNRRAPTHLFQFHASAYTYIPGDGTSLVTSGVNYMGQQRVFQCANRVHLLFRG